MWLEIILGIILLLALREVCKKPKDLPPGLSGSDGLPWHNTRRFTLRHLSDLGMGRTSMVEAIQMEAREMIKGFEACSRGLSDLDQFLNVAVVNVIWQLLSNRRYNVGDEDSKWFHKLILDMQHGYDRIFILDFFPWLTKVLPLWIQKKIFGYEKLMEMKEQISGYFMNIIEEHKENLDPTNPRDFIDAYLIEMEDRRGDPRNTFKEKDLVSTLWDLYVAGSDTASNTLRWFILYMAKYPKVQRRAQREIDDVIPRNVQPSWEDKDSLPYTEAIIHEVHRMVSLTPLGIQHTTTKDVRLSNGYRIPKGSILYPVGFCSHNDDRHWDNPFEFRPERFLDDNGKFFCPKDGFMPFGVGRRQCVGEPLARMEAIIFCASLLQKLYFSPGPNGVILESMQIPIVNHPKHQWVKVDFRKDVELSHAA
ncbi:cytochrome P450 2L1-like isoform X2 [Oratosquilla oratoria]|uniref:cytochrome P450 2L1-like isoform X2 n=1 Tax=Oratosquilla oratoria TaxID=337810 RepID=UPI003F758E5A